MLTIGIHIGGSQSKPADQVSLEPTPPPVETPKSEPKKPEPTQLETMNARCKVGEPLFLDLKLLWAEVGPLAGNGWFFIEEFIGWEGKNYEYMGFEVSNVNDSSQLWSFEVKCTKPGDDILTFIAGRESQIA